MAIYKVVSKVTPEGEKAVESTLLVESRTKAGAVNHVAQKTITAELVEGAALVALGSQGMLLEKAAS